MKNYCLKFNLLFAAILFVALGMSAQTDVGSQFILSNSENIELKYEIIDENSVALIPNGYKGDIVVPETVEYSGKSYMVTELIADGDRLFGTKVTKVEIPSTITAMIVRTEGKAIFFGATLPEIELPSSLERIEGRLLDQVRGFTKLVVPDKVKEIPTGFISSVPLEELTLGAGITKINSSSFEFMSKLTKLSLKSTEVPELCEGAFGNISVSQITLEVPKGCKEKYESSSEWNAFKEIVEYEEVVEEPESEIFTVTLNGVDFKFETLGGSSVALLPNGYEGDIVVPETVEYSGKSYTVTELIADGDRLFGTNVTKVEFPSTITAMIVRTEGKAIFFGATLSELEFPSSLERIEGRLLDQVRGITKLVVPDKVKEIPTGFISSVPLEELTLGAGITKINSSSFEFMSKMTKLSLKSTEVPELCEGAFGNILVSQITLEVPKGCKEKYESSSEWNAFKEIIEYEEVVEEPEPEIFTVTLNGVDFKFETLGGSSVALLPNGYKGDIVVPETVEYSGKSYTVTELIADGDRLFGTKVTKVEIPSTITAMIVRTEGKAIFFGATLPKLELPSSLERIEGRLLDQVRGFTKLVVPDKVKEIPTGFISSVPLEELTLGAGITKINSSSFEFMSKLYKIEVLATDVPELASDAFNFIDTRVITIQVPTGCKALYEASEPWQMFKEIIEGAGGLDVGDVFIMSDETGTDFKFEVIGDGELALLANSYVGSIEIPVFVTYMNSLFQVKEIRGDENGEVPVFDENVVSVLVPEGVEKFSGLIFGGTNITKLELPESLITYGKYNFKGLSKLYSLTLPSIETLESYTVSDCSGLKEIVFKRVNNIDADAFNGCVGLEKFKFEQNIVPNAKTGAFNGLTTSNITVFVPNGAKKSYELNWNEYGFKGFEEYDLTSIDDVNVSGQCKVVDGGIILPDLNYSGYAYVYNISGELLLRTLVVDGFVEFNNVKGFYLIKVDDQVYKVYVK